MNKRIIYREEQTLNKGTVNVTKLCKRYGDFTAVDNVSFHIKKGEIFGFLGPNGAGKTTTINMMIGLAKPTSGAAFINGIDVIKNLKRAQAAIGVVPDESNLYDEMNGFDNLCFCASLYGMEKQAREKRAQELLKQFDLEKAGNRPFKAYSKGMRRKLTIAAGIIHSPDILFLDEPTTGIDVESARHIRQLLLELKEMGTTVFMTTHYIEDAQRICDRIAFIVKGKIVALDTVSKLMDSVSSGPAVRFLTNSASAELADGIKSSFCNYNVTCSGGDNITVSSAGRIDIAPIVAYLHDKEVKVYEARELRPTLEDVFVKITGIDAANLKKEKEKGASGK